MMTVNANLNFYISRIAKGVGGGAWFRQKESQGSWSFEFYNVQTKNRPIVKKIMINLT